MKVIIAGGRDFNDYSLLAAEANKLENVTAVISGCARGADSLGERWAQETGLPILKFPANWDMYGKAAGFIRNAEMAHEGDFLLAFWNGKSRGTENMITAMQKEGKHGRIVKY